MTWRDFFDRDHALYVSERHKLLHADLVAKGVASHIPRPDAQVLDYGCGEALGAAHLSGRCAKLFLFDTAPSVRAKLVAANVARANVVVLDEAGVAAIPNGSLDMIVVVSVLQYVGEAELARLLGAFHDKLKDDGKLVLADLIPKDVSPLDDARALLDFGLHGGFLVASIVGHGRSSRLPVAIKERLQLAHEIDRQIGIIERRLADHRPEFDLPGNGAALGLRLCLCLLIKGVVDAYRHAHASPRINLLLL